jgi:hypothetical protein
VSIKTARLAVGTRKQEARLVGRLSRFLLVVFQSLKADIVSEALSARQSPAAKIPFLAACWKAHLLEQLGPDQAGSDAVHKNARLRKVSRRK